MSVDRQCASGLMAIATAAKQIISDDMRIAVGGGLESISLVQNDHMNRFRAADPWLLAHRDDIYMAMLETAEIVAERYDIPPRGAGRIRPAIAAAHRRRAGRRAVRRGDRAAADDNEGAGQGDRRGERQGDHAQGRTRATGPTPRWRGWRR